MIENLTSNLSKAETEEHEKKWGGYNYPPPGFTEITAEEFAQSGFFTWCKERMEFRQIDPSQIDQSKMLSPVTTFLSITLFFMNHGEHYGLSNDYWDKKVRYFKFADCYHDWKEVSGSPAWNCYHYYKCTKCGASWEVDSSD